MTPTALLLAATALGILIGAGTSLAIVAARRAGRRRAEAMRPELPEIATTILDEIETFAVILDASLTPVYANPTARYERFISGEELSDPEFLRRARRVMTTGIPDTREPDTSVPGDSIRVHIIRIQARFLAVLAEDIGEEQRVNAMRRDFIANVSHELKTPIAAIGLLAEATQEAADDSETVRGFAKSLVKESRRLGELSRDIIQLSEAQSTLRPEDRQAVSLPALVRREVESHREFASQHGVELVVTGDNGLDAVIQGRAASLSAAVANLLSNAIRHSPEGGRVGVGMEVKRNSFVVTVTDQGEGIAPEHLGRIFERFYRVDGARTRGEGGTGLGLSIARHTMRAHGGDIDVWSQQGVGSSFSLTFPRHDAEDAEKSTKRLKKAKRALRQARAAEVSGEGSAAEAATGTKGAS
ncbi:sensor histidine kinase [Leucobacter ruminantium]|uniref:Sensor-like histidine kinase SenX3 n=1 Tax=Leucobacter ruminantium TaxID=1289170 RepID=A0A939M0I1_9MICO|nr:ATP-binding protein [Leucobacter ruminantium]MBO1804825.1 histidine kinase [Leucobacter ruminantium]